MLEISFNLEQENVKFSIKITGDRRTNNDGEFFASLSKDFPLVYFILSDITLTGIVLRSPVLLDLIDFHFFVFIPSLQMC